MTLEIPDRIAAQIPYNHTELMQEFAIFLYEQEILSLRAAADLASVSWVQMEQILAERGIEMHYGIKELEEDLSNLEKLK